MPTNISTVAGSISVETCLSGISTRLHTLPQASIVNSRASGYFDAPYAHCFPIVHVCSTDWIDPIYDPLQWVNVTPNHQPFQPSLSGSTFELSIFRGSSIGLNSIPMLPQPVQLGSRAYLNDLVWFLCTINRFSKVAKKYCPIQPSSGLFLFYYISFQTLFNPIRSNFMTRSAGSTQSMGLPSKSAHLST